MTKSKVIFYIILATATEFVEESTTTIDSCDRLNRRAGVVGRRDCGTTTTTTTSGGIQTIAVIPGTNSQSLMLQIFAGTQTPTSPRIFSVSDLRNGSTYAGYRSGDSVLVRQISNLGGGDRAWSDGYTVQPPSDPINGVVITEVYVNPYFYLKHLAGIRPRFGTPSPINSVIPRGAKVTIFYIGESSSVVGSHDFRVQISSYQRWKIASGGIYKFQRNEINKEVVLSGTHCPYRRQNNQH